MTLLIIAIVLIVVFYFSAVALSGFDSSPSTNTLIAIGTAFCTSIGLTYFFYKRCKKKDIVGFKRFALVLLVPLFIPIGIAFIINSISNKKRRLLAQTDYTKYNEYYVTIKLENGAKYNGAFDAKYDNLNGNATKTGTFTIFNKTNGKGYNGFVDEIKSIETNGKVPVFDGRI